MFAQLLVCGACLSGLVGFVSSMNQGLYGSAFNVPIFLAGVMLLEMILHELKKKNAPAPEASKTPQTQP